MLQTAFGPRDRVPSGSMLALPVHTFFDSTGILYMHWLPTVQTVNKKYYVEVLREFRKRLL